MKKFVMAIFILGLVFVNVTAGADSMAINDVKVSLVADKTSAIEDEEVNVSVMFSCEEDINTSAFRLRVSFDSSKFIYKGLYSDYSSSDFKTHEKDDVLTILYLTSDRGINIAANSNTCLFELNFKSTSDDLIVGNSTFNAAIDGLCNYDCVELPCAYIDPITIEKVNKEPANCDLKSLTLDDYSLSPVFSADVTKYIINVPYSKSSIEFEATPEDPEASVKVSRKTLNSAGKSTDINITVTSPDKKSKKVYTVTVNRGTKDITAAESEKSSKSKSSTKSKSSSKSTSSINSSSKNGKSPSENAISSNSQGNPTLVVKENNFNFALFFTVSAVLVLALVFLLRKDKKNNK